MIVCHVRGRYILMQLQGALDGHVILWHFDSKAFSSCQLSGACRCLQVLCQRGARARLLAGAGEGVAELSVARSGLQQQPEGKRRRSDAFSCRNRLFHWLLLQCSFYNLGLFHKGEELVHKKCSFQNGSLWIQRLRFVAAYVEVASMSFRATELQRQDMEQGRWPRSFLEGLRVAVGGVDGQLALLLGSCRAVHELFKSGDQEVISIAPGRGKRSR